MRISATLWLKTPRRFLSLVLPSLTSYTSLAKRSTSADENSTSCAAGMRLSARGAACSGYSAKALRAALPALSLLEPLALLRFCASMIQGARFAQSRDRPLAAIHEALNTVPHQLTTQLEAINGVRPRSQE